MTTLSSKPDTLRIILLIAACFAIGSIGMFAAVYLQTLSHENTSDSSSSIHQLPATQASKEAVMESLSVSSTSTGDVAGRVSNVPPAQADVHDPHAAQKLKVLESLNAH